jgi:hypothetical protein
MKRTYEICWNIFRSNKDHPQTKVIGTDCPCNYDPVNNPKCPIYEAVVISPPKERT